MATRSIYNLYKADYNPISNHPNVNTLYDVFDQGNPHFEQTEQLTADGKFERIVHRSIDHLYYRDFETNTKATFGSGNPELQTRYLEDQAYVLSLPQSKFGEAILPGSVTIKMKWSLGANSGSYYVSGSTTELTGLWTVEDDIYGNLYISGGYYSPYGQLVGGAYTNYTTSISIPLIGEWPLSDIYKWVNAGPFSLTSSYSKGFWQMQSLYNNVSAFYITGSTTPYPSDVDLLGAVMHFTSSLSSSITLKPQDISQYLQAYNFENEDFSISMMLRPTEAPSHTSGSVIIQKQALVEELRIDSNGNVYSQPAPTQYPYKITYTSGSQKIKFEKKGATNTFSVTSSVALEPNNLYHVVAIKSGSVYSIHVNSTISSSINSGSTTIPDKQASNLAPIHIGNSYTKDQGFNGVIDNFKIYRGVLSQNEIKLLHHTIGVGNLFVGNVFYNHGMMVLGAIPVRFADVISVNARGTHTIYETEISCTVQPGEFGMSTNPTLQEYNPQQNQFVYRSFVTSSYFKPYITSIGLYDDFGQLLAIGKLNTPIQTPNNMDTTFIIRYDR